MRGNGDVPSINQLERDTRNGLTRALRGAYRAARSTPRTPAQARRAAETVARSLREATAPAAETINRHTRDAILNGAHTGRSEAPPPPGATLDTEPSTERIIALAQDLPISQTTRDALREAALALETRPAQQLIANGAAEDVQHAETRLWTGALTYLHRARNRGRAWYARLFAYDLRWHTEEDERVCPECGPMHGLVIASQERFANQAADWDAYDGQPPAHPRCRCEAQVVRRGLLRR